jgi:hypothetical protein
MAAVAAAAEAGTLRVDDELHFTPLAAEEEDPQGANLRAAFDRRIGEAQLPELILAVDAEVRFSWIMRGREPRSTVNGGLRGYHCPRHGALRRTDLQRQRELECRTAPIFDNTPRSVAVNTD